VPGGVVVNDGGAEAGAAGATNTPDGGMVADAGPGTDASTDASTDAATDAGGTSGTDAGTAGPSGSKDSGSCGCRVAGGSGSREAGAWFGVLAAGALVFARRRRAARRSGSARL
jgi:MYXO-CTERM domain-containing protein